LDKNFNLYLSEDTIHLNHRHLDDQVGSFHISECNASILRFDPRYQSPAWLDHRSAISGGSIEDEESAIVAAAARFCDRR
jgi:hypothetical protein